MNALRLYRRYAAVSIRSQLQYRASVIINALGIFAQTAVEFVAIWSLFQRFGQIRGWTLPEIALFYGIISITWALTDALGRGFDVFATMVKQGDFDRLLLRPRSTVLQLLGHELTVRRVGRLAQGCLVLAYAIGGGEIAWTVPRVLLLAAAIASGMCIFLGLLVLQATSAFWTTESLEVWNAFTYGGVTLSQYPLAIYRSWMRALFTFAIPLACASYFPALVILGRSDRLVHWLAPLGGPAFLALAFGVWRIGVRHYRSTGS